MNHSSFKIAVSAGELSGDMYAARVVARLKVRAPESVVKGMGGAHLRAEGVTTIVDSERSGSVMGFVEVAGKLPTLITAYRKMKQLLLEWRPDVLVLVDYPDFNLRLAQFARHLGIRVVYFIPPKVWIWRKGRVRTLRRATDAVVTIFPHEKKFLEENGVKNVSYVGHPLAQDSKVELPDSSTLREKFGLKPSNPVVAVFPGSRPQEIRRHAPLLAEAMRTLRTQLPTVQFAIAKASTVTEEALREVSQSVSGGVAVVADGAPTVFRMADVGLVKCGTSNIEAAIHGVPLVSFFVTSGLSAAVVKAIVPTPYFSLVNLIRPGTIPELMQHHATPQRLAEEVVDLLTHPSRRDAMKVGLAEVADSLASHESNPLWHGALDVADRAAVCVLGALATPTRARYSLRDLFPFISPYRVHFIGAILCMMIFGASDGAVPFLVKYILDGVFSNKDAHLLYLLPVFLIVFALVRAFADFGQQYLMAKVGHQVVRDIRNVLTRRLLAMSTDFFHRHSVGEILSRFTSDVLLVRSMLTDGLSSVLRDTVRIVALLGTAFYLDPFLALIACVGFPIGVIPVVRFGKKIRRYTSRSQESLGALGGVTQEMMQGNRVVKIFNRETHESERFERTNRELTASVLSAERFRALTGPINEVLAAFAVSGVILYGGVTVLGGTRTQGEFLAFLVSVFLLYDPFKKLSKVATVFQQGMSGAERILEIAELQPSVREPLNPVPLPSGSDIEFCGVSFRYGPGLPPVLSDISFKVKEGSCVALVGFSGSGKSTLVDLVPRFMDPSGGAVTIGGVDIASVSLEELRGRISMVGQHTFLFNDTIRANIAYGSESANDEEIVRAAQAAHAMEFIERLPKKFDTIVGEGGYTLSGGERQRIAIARAILKNSPILILDEATASLDNRSERAVQQALDALERGRTTIVIAHRLSTVRSADEILVMREGRIVERGAHEDLLKRGGEYAELHAMQFAESRSEKAGISDVHVM